MARRKRSRYNEQTGATGDQTESGSPFERFTHESENPQNTPPEGTTDPHNQEQSSNINEGLHGTRTWQEDLAAWRKEFAETGTIPKGVPKRSQIERYFQALVNLDKERHRDYVNRGLIDPHDPEGETTKADPYIGNPDESFYQQTRSALNEILYTGDPSKRAQKVTRTERIDREGKRVERESYTPMDENKLHQQIDDFIKQQLYGKDFATGRDVLFADEDLINRFKKLVVDSYLGRSTFERQLLSKGRPKDPEAGKRWDRALAKAQALSTNDRRSAQAEGERLANRLAQKAAGMKSRNALMSKLSDQSAGMFPDEHGIFRVPSEKLTPRQLRERVENTRRARELQAYFDRIPPKEQRLDSPDAATLLQSAGIDSKPLARAKWEAKSTLEKLTAKKSGTLPIGKKTQKVSVLSKKLETQYDLISAHKRDAEMAEALKQKFSRPFEVNKDWSKKETQIARAEYMNQRAEAQRQYVTATRQLTEAHYHATDLQNQLRELGDLPVKPEWFGGVRQQARFTKNQVKNKIDAGKQGTLTVAFNSKGDVVPADSKEVAFRLGPNVQWKYKVKDETADNPLRTKDEYYPYWDKKVHFKNRGGDGREDPLAHEHVEMTLIDDFGNPYTVRKPLVHEKLVPKYKRPVSQEQGTKKIKGRSEKLPDYISKEIFVPMAGVKPHSKEVDDPERYEQKFVRSVMHQEAGAIAPGQGERATGPFIPATPEEWREAKRLGIPVEEKAVHKKIRYTFIDPRDLEAKSDKDKDVLSVKIPGNKFDNKYMRELKNRGLLEPGTEELGGRVLNMNFDPDSLAGKTIFRPIQAQQEQILRKKSFRAGYLKNHPWEVGSAAAMAAYYSQMKLTKEHRIPTQANRLYGKVLDSNPKLRAWASDIALTEKDDKLFAVKASLRPFAERTSNIGYGIAHPLSGLDGQQGVSVGSWRYRKRFFPFGNAQATIATREAERLSRKVDLTLKVKEKVADNAHKKGLTGVFNRWQASPLKRTTEYKDTGALIDDTIRAARSARNVNPSHTSGFQQAVAIEVKARAQRKMLRDQDSGKGTQSPNIIRIASPTHIAPPHTAKPWKGEAPRWKRGGGLTEMPRRLALVPTKKTGPTRGRLGLTPMERNVAIGGAAIATAIGAHYAYHKYQQSKLAPEERISYVNKITPGPIKVPLPYVRATQHYTIPANTFTNEFNFTNRQMPTRFAVGLKNRTLWKGSPADRGYGKNAKLGVFGVKGAGVKPQGSFASGLVHDPTIAFNTRKTFRPPGKQVVVKGKKLPVRVEVSQAKKIKLSATNPNRLSQKDREDIIWAFHGRSDEDKVKSFFAHGKQDKILDMWNDPELLDKIRIRRGEQEARHIGSRKYIPESASWLSPSGRTRLTDAPVPPDDVSPQITTAEDLKRSWLDADAIARGDRRPFMGRGTPGDRMITDIGGLTPEGTQRKLGSQEPIGKLDERVNPKTGKIEQVMRPSGRNAINRVHQENFEAGKDTPIKKYRKRK